jgi:hypothetical protein
VAGVLALGVGVVVNAIVEVVILAFAVRRLCGARLLMQAAVPTAVGVLAGVAGIAVNIELGLNFESAVLASVVALGCALLGLALTNRGDLVASFRLAQEAVGNVLSRSHRRRGEAATTGAPKMSSSATVE